MVKLSRYDLQRLRGYEAQIQKYFSDAPKVAGLLKTIRDEKLYHEYGHETFEEYLDKKWQISRQRGYQMISWATVAEELPKQMSTIVDTESKAREVAKIPAKDRVEILRQAIKTGQTVTAKVIREVHADAVTGMHEVEPVRDDTKYMVPAPALPFWERRFEVKQLIESIQQVKNEICKAFKEEDLLYFGRGKLNQTITTDIEDVIRHLKSVLPYAVCPYCQGKLIDKCAYCNRTGVIDRDRFNAAPQELLKMREKVTKGVK